MIRQLSPVDVDVFRQIRLESLRCEPLAFASYVEDWQDLPDAEWSRRLDEDQVFVSFEGTEPVGIMGLVTHAQSKMAHRGLVVLVYLQAFYRGQGKAEDLMKALEAHALTNGITQLELEVSAENPKAIQFYERMGFQRIGLIPAGFKHHGREMDQVLMMRRLTS